MATSYVSNDIQSNNPSRCYDTSTFFPIVMILFSFDCLLTFTYPLFKDIYNYLFNIWILMAIQPFLAMGLPYLLRLFVTHVDLIKYIEKQDEKKLRLYGNIIFFGNLLSIYLAGLFFYLVYIKG